MYISTDHVYVYGAAITRYGIMHIEHIYHLKQVLISNEKVRTDGNNVEREKRETVSCTKLYYVTHYHMLPSYQFTFNMNLLLPADW